MYAYAVPTHPSSQGQAIAEVFFIIIFPPAAIFIHNDCICNIDVCLNLIICILFLWIGGAVHAVWLCFIRDRQSNEVL